jgi:hypothetical protein
MSSRKNDVKDKTTMSYTSPEIVNMGKARELTAGNLDEILSDGSPKPNGYKDVEIRPSLPPTDQ